MTICWTPLTSKVFFKVNRVYQVFGYPYSLQHLSRARWADLGNHGNVFFSASISWDHLKRDINPDVHVQWARTVSQRNEDIMYLKTTLSRYVVGHEDYSRLITVQLEELKEWIKHL